MANACIARANAVFLGFQFFWWRIDPCFDWFTWFTRFRFKKKFGTTSKELFFVRFEKYKFRGMKFISAKKSLASFKNINKLTLVVLLWVYNMNKSKKSKRW